MPLLFLHIPKKKREVNAMRCMLCIQCAIRGLLTINGQFCGPVDGEGQTFPTARDAEIFIEYMPLTENAKPMALELALEQGKVSRIEPAPHGYALIWPDGLIQLELRPEAPDMPEVGETEQAAPNVLLRYLTMRLAGDAGADALLMRAGAAEGLPAYDADMITGQKALADFFEQTVALGAEPKQVSNWIMGEVMGQLSARGLEARDMVFSPAALARLIALVQEGKLNRNTAVKVFEAVFEHDEDVDAYVQKHGLEQVSDAGLVGCVAEEVFAANPKSIEDYKAGKEKAFGFLVGQVMRQLKGQADPAVVRRVLRMKLEQN